METDNKRLLTQEEVDVLIEMIDWLKQNKCTCANNGKGDCEWCLTMEDVENF